MEVLGKERDYIVHDEKNIKGMYGEYRFLSNFEMCEVVYEGLRYTSSEAAYQSAKVCMEQRHQFTSLKPGDAMRLGRKLQNTGYSVGHRKWEETKYEVMAAVVFDKYFRNPELRRKLLETGDKYIEETNH